MVKNSLGKNGVLGAFKLAVLLTLVLGTVWFIYNYLQTGSFSLRPSAKGGDCTTSAQCGSGYLCKAGVCVKNVADTNCCTTKQLKSGYSCIKVKNRYSCELKNVPVVTTPKIDCSFVMKGTECTPLSKSTGRGYDTAIVCKGNYECSKTTYYSECFGVDEPTCNVCGGIYLGSNLCGVNFNTVINDKDCVLVEGSECPYIK